MYTACCDTWQNFKCTNQGPTMRLQAAVLFQQSVQHNAETGKQCSPKQASAKSQALQIKTLLKTITVDASPQEENPCCYCQELFYKLQRQGLALLQILALFIIANFPCQRFFGVALFLQTKASCTSPPEVTMPNSLFSKCSSCSFHTGKCLISRSCHLKPVI